MDDRLLDGLNQAQKEAVMSTDGPVMVMAGAGSGKTRVLTNRIAYILENKPIPPSSILAVTFTNKAAREMKERIERLIDINTKYMWISTFHSFCARLLRLEIDSLPPFNSKFNILDEEDSLKIVKEIMKANDIDDYKPKEIRNLISKGKNFTNYKTGIPHLDSIYHKVEKLYQARLMADNLLDFDDLIIKTIELFKKNPSILEKYQYKFQYILVDEFQDTNDLQYKLIYMLGIRHHNIFVVGDDFQSIYSFRGANIANIKKFRDDFIEHKLILLEENYRSTTQILDLANRVIEKNPNQIKKVMFSQNTNGQLPFYYQANSAYGEVMFVVDKIRELHMAGDNYKDFAIMYRANYISRSFEEMLVRYQIPYKIYGGLSFFSRKEIKDMIAYLKIIIDSKDNFSFRRIINEPRRKIGPSLLEKLQNEAMLNGVSLFEAIPNYKGTGQGALALRQFYEMINSIRAELNNIPLKNIIDVLLDETGYKQMLKEEDDENDRLSNVLEFKTVLKETDEVEDGDNFDKLSKLLYDLSLRTDTDDDDMENDDCVRLTTYHQAKGLEFKNVFMVAMEEGIFPSNYHHDDLDLEEERRICYVGITRAKRKLYLTCAQSRFLFGSESYMQPSRYINEMGKELFKNISKKYQGFEYSQPKTTLKIVEEEKKEVKETISINFKIGDKINHKIFGDGLVVGVDGDVINVAFKMPTGIKKLKGNHPSIIKL